MINTKYFNTFIFLSLISNLKQGLTIYEHRKTIDSTKNSLSVFKNIAHKPIEIYF